MAISIRQDTWLLPDLYRERKKCLEVLLCRLVQREETSYIYFHLSENLNPMLLWSKILHDLERVTEDQQNISAMKHDILWTHPQETFAWGKKTTVNLKQADLAEGGLFISHAAQTLWCEVFEMTVATKDRSSGKEHALGTCCGSSSCEEDISLENSTQRSTSATSIKWKKANLFPKSQTIYSQCTY